MIDKEIDIMITNPYGDLYDTSFDKEVPKKSFPSNLQPAKKKRKKKATNGRK